MSQNPDTRPLPRGWTTSYDPSTGRWYYRNGAQAAWHHPADYQSLFCDGQRSRSSTDGQRGSAERPAMSKAQQLYHSSFTKEGAESGAILQTPSMPQSDRSPTDSRTYPSINHSSTNSGDYLRRREIETTAARTTQNTFSYGEKHHSSTDPSPNQASQRRPDNRRSTSHPQQGVHPGPNSPASSNPHARPPAATHPLWSGSPATTSEVHASIAALSKPNLSAGPSNGHIQPFSAPATPAISQHSPQVPSYNGVPHPPAQVMSSPGVSAPAQNSYVNHQPPRPNPNGIVHNTPSTVNYQPPPPTPSGIAHTAPPPNGSQVMLQPNNRTQQPSRSMGSNIGVFAGAAALGLVGAAAVQALSDGDDSGSGWNDTSNSSTGFTEVVTTDTFAYDTVDYSDSNYGQYETYDASSAQFTETTTTMMYTNGGGNNGGGNDGLNMGKMAHSLGQIASGYHEHQQQAGASNQQSGAPINYIQQNFQQTATYGNPQYPANPGYMHPNVTQQYGAYPGTAGYPQQHGYPMNGQQAHATNQPQPNSQQQPSAMSGVGKQIASKLAVKAGVAVGGAIIGGLLGN